MGAVFSAGSDGNAFCNNFSLNIWGGSGVSLLRVFSLDNSVSDGGGGGSFVGDGSSGETTSWIGVGSAVAGASSFPGGDVVAGVAILMEDRLGGGDEASLFSA